jgi:5'-phosphate synthase pdxT subunit
LHKIGVLAIQGDFYKHCLAIETLKHKAIEVRKTEDLSTIDALIIPGGESTTFVRLFAEFNLSDDIVDFATKHPIMGTCAGLIVLSKKVDHLPFKPLGLIDITVKRNAYGRQKESFVDDITLCLNGKEKAFPGVFIRAPKIDQIGSRVKVLAKHKSDIVMVESSNILVATFHPELTENSEIHRYFIDNFI